MKQATATWLARSGWAVRLSKLNFAALCLAARAALAVTFTNDATIGFNDISYEGQNIVVSSNCTLTIDGTHSFANMQILAGGVVTHSGSSNGLIDQVFSRVESHVLSNTNFVTLAYPVFDTNSIALMDETQTMVYTNGVDYVVSLSSTVLGNYAEILRTAESSIVEGMTNVVSYQAVLTEAKARMSLTISNKLEIESGGAINLTGKGHGGGSGSGAGASRLTNTSPSSYTGGSGGGHGGYGGMSTSGALGGNGYGSMTNPSLLGSGGGAGEGWGGSGGGLAEITVGDLLRVDGQILVDGTRATNSHAGGGSGGSLWLNVKSCSGSGMISARGGSGELPNGGGGGGGRIAIFYETNSFTGEVTAKGGAGKVYGGAGTIYWNDSQQTVRHLFLDNGGKSGANTFYSASGIGLHDLTIIGGATISTNSISVRNIWIGSNSWIMAVSNQNLVINATNLTVAAGGGIDANVKGASGGAGAGNGYPNTSGGAGYGGMGAVGGYPGNYSSGKSYGSYTNPVDQGSGGASISNPSTGGKGGGAVNLTVNGQLILDGQITANGGSGSTTSSGGGSGGSVLLKASSIDGAGLISANGGAGMASLGGGGGGGRIAVYAFTNRFTGRVTAYGGSGWLGGGAGTIYISSGPTGSSRSLLIDNGGLEGVSTPVTLLSFSDDLVVRGGASYWSSNSSFTVNNFFLGSNSMFHSVAPLSSPTIDITVRTNAVIEANSGLMADGRGSAGGQGGGYGRTYNSIGGGGGYGGYGGQGATNNGNGGGAFGGNTYGSITDPSSDGSGGSGGGTGGGTSPYNLGGAGGGKVRFIVSGSLRLDGQITANGLAGVGTSSGGGSGGAVYVSAGKLFGLGSISANGGVGRTPFGGGGGGGRIAVYCGTNDFTGSISAAGASGWANGGAGTVYMATNSQAAGHLLVDNHGLREAITPMASPLLLHTLTINGGAVLSNGYNSSLTLTNLFIGSNSWYLLRSSSYNLLTVRGHAVIEATGGISLDGKGSTFGGSGTGGQYSGTEGGGGGHGGEGGASAGGYRGGSTTGSISNPTSPGGAGGGSSGLSTGGAGGGAGQLSVTGTLTLHGSLTANGLSAITNASGGGAGGSIHLTVGRLFGHGTIAANGGAGETPRGGGGGGGRIAVFYQTNDFTGSLRARGGSGANYGGAGTIYMQKQNSGQPPQVTLDNDGMVGAVTPMTIGSSYDLTIGNGASVLAGYTTSGTLANLLIKSNGWLHFTNTSSTTFAVASNAVIEAGGGISVSGRGYTGYQGNSSGSYNFSPLFGYTGGGGSHGGLGGSSISGASAGLNAYDSIVTPIQIGSSGGANVQTGIIIGGAGGGALRLMVQGNFILDGSLTADGFNGGGGGGGGGSGGSVYLTVNKTFSGSGAISANGGMGDWLYGGGGGGGRIAVYHSTNQFTGSMTAFGGLGAVNGGAGTIYLHDHRQNVQKLLVANAGLLGAFTPISYSGSLVDFSVLAGAFAVQTSPSPTYRELYISSNAWLTVATNTSLTMTLLGDATIEKGGGFMLEGRGHKAPSGWGYPIDGGIGGGGHGGNGGDGTAYAAGSAYGSLTTPTNLGASGLLVTNSGGGGGALRLITSQTLLLDGEINVDGSNGLYDHGGGGAGGSVWLTVGNLAGRGVINANGGSGLPTGGGGGGGRIAVYYDTNQFAGTLSAHGGDGWMRGGAGTIYTRATNSGTPEIMIDNDGFAGANTPLHLTEVPRLTIAGGASVIPENGYLELENLSLSSNSVLQGSLTLTVMENALLDGWLLAEGAGGSNLGDGSFSGSGSGGGHGGAGGRSAAGVPGGPVHDAAAYPSGFGGRGGRWFPPAAADLGGEGGGAVRLIVAGTTTVNGGISANGNDAFYDRAGGGAGGSVWITTSHFTGNGRLLAQGGNGEPDEGGGGGGGRIALYTRTNAFTGDISVAGGEGFQDGGVGTIFFSNLLAPKIVDQYPTDTFAPIYGALNNLHFYFDMPVDPASVSAADFILTSPNGPVTLTNVYVSGNAIVLLFPFQTGLGTYTVQAGPQINGIFGDPMGATYTGSFTILPATISGVVKDAAGVPVAGVTLQPGDTSLAVVTDTNGYYSFIAPPSWTGSLTPLSTNVNATFIPPIRSYAQTTAPATNQNFTLALPENLAVSSRMNGTNLTLGIFGISGVTYQVYSSTNLVDWTPYGSALVGTNGAISVNIPLNEPNRFLKFQVGN